MIECYSGGKGKLFRFLDETGLSRDMSNRLAAELHYRGDLDFYNIRLLVQFNPIEHEYQITMIVSCLDNQTISLRHRIPAEVLDSYE